MAEKFDPANPWSFDAFDPPNPRVPSPAPRGTTPRLFPEEDRLFKAQRDALQAVNSAKELERAMRGNTDRRIDATLRDIVQDTETTYRTIRSYLEKYVAPASAL